MEAVHRDGQPGHWRHRFARRTARRRIEADELHLVDSADACSPRSSIPRRRPKSSKRPNALTFRNVITVNLMLKKKQVTHDTWLYVHDRNILFGRFHEPKNWSAAMVPERRITPRSWSSISARSAIRSGI